MEGGIALYEDIQDNKDPLLIDLVGEVLYTLRIHISECQQQLQQEVQHHP